MKFEQEAPGRLYLAAVKIRETHDGAVGVVRSNVYRNLPTARMRLSTLEGQYGDKLVDGWIETTETQWSVVDELTTSRRKCSGCGKTKNTVYERTDPTRTTVVRYCEDCFDRLLETEEGR